MTLEEARRELQQIIYELHEIESGIRRDFNGIGEDLCANCINRIETKYEDVLGLLNRVDYNVVASWFVKKS